MGLLSAIFVALAMQPENPGPLKAAQAYPRCRRTTSLTPDPWPSDIRRCSDVWVMVCKYIYIYIYIYVCIYIYECTFTFVYICACLCEVHTLSLCTCVYMSLYIYVYMYLHALYTARTLDTHQKDALPHPGSQTSAPSTSGRPTPHRSTTRPAQTTRPLLQVHVVWLQLWCDEFHHGFSGP